MKPGKPFLFATATGGECIFGLPGNPLSALTALHEFVLPALRRMAGHTPEEARPSLWLPLSTTVAGRGERDRYLPSCIRWTRDGPRAEVLPVRDSGDVLAAAQAEGMVIIPARGPRMEVGGLVEFRSWSARS
jgi:molybdopterin biosynthesis enzyme